MSARELKDELRRLIRSHATLTSDVPIRLSSGAETRQYFDGKQITLFPERAVLFARLLLEELDVSRFDAVGGMSVGADPIVSALSVTAFLEKGLKVPGFFVRKEAKKHGLQKMIEGVELKKGMKTLVVDDVITQGTATLKAIEAVEQCGAVVEQVACLVDREEGGSAALGRKYRFYAAFRKSEL